MKIKRIDENGLVYVKIWRGRSLKPDYYRFRNVEQRDKHIEHAKESEIMRIEDKAASKLRRIREIEAMLEQIQVGTILHHGWGYEQTQCDYFEVTEKRGHMVTVRKIGAETVSGSEAFMSDQRRPVPG